jgi:hypothetical protein
MESLAPSITMNHEPALEIKRPPVVRKRVQINSRLVNRSLENIEGNKMSSFRHKLNHHQNPYRTMDQDTVDVVVMLPSPSIDDPSH